MGTRMNFATVEGKHERATWYMTTGNLPQPPLPRIRWRLLQWETVVWGYKFWIKSTEMIQDHLKHILHLKVNELNDEITDCWP